jgi:nitrile hydratase subunit alpha
MHPGNPDNVSRSTASMEDRVNAVQALLDDQGLNACAGVLQLDHLATEEWVPKNGARVVAHAALALDRWPSPLVQRRLDRSGGPRSAAFGTPAGPAGVVLSLTGGSQNR